MTNEARDADFDSVDSQEAEEALEPALEEGQEAHDDSDLDESDRLRGEAAEVHDKYLRALAELENFKKRAAKERSELIKYQGEAVFADIVEVLDNLELALGHTEGDPEQFRDGIALIHKQFVDVLAKWQVVGESGVGQPFDPNSQTAISQIPAGEYEPGSVVNELKKAYFYKDKLIRAAEVVVASTDFDQPEDDSEE